jgi:hypothetical protein
MTTFEVLQHRISHSDATAFKTTPRTGKTPAEPNHAAAAIRTRGGILIGAVGDWRRTVRIAALKIVRIHHGGTPFVPTHPKLQIQILHMLTPLGPFLDIGLVATILHICAGVK